MPQEIRILKCCECKQFQTDIVKKAKKWICKLCGVRQSVMQEYGRGTGKECRLQVQKLNETKATRETSENSFLANEYFEKCNNTDTNAREIVKDPIIMKPNDENNKWSNFVDQPDTSSEKEDIFNCNLQQRHLNSQNFQQSVKKPHLKRRLTSEECISFNKHEDECFVPEEINVTEEHHEKKSFNILIQEEQSVKINRIERNEMCPAKLKEVVQPSSHETSKKSKWNQFIDKEEVYLKYMYAISRINI